MQKPSGQIPRHPTEAGQGNMAVPRERQKPRHRHKGADGLSARDHPCSRSRSESAKRHDDRRALLRRRESHGHAVRPRGRPAFYGEPRKRAGEHERAQKREERPRRKRQRGEQGKLQNKVHDNTDDPEGARPRVVHDLELSLARGPTCKRIGGVAEPV